uniref:RING-type domain-containing protein n=1 Tax=Caenorhabditis japonica TaxID=281687 RepID=A0A8R1E3K4_CAEJA
MHRRGPRHRARKLPDDALGFEFSAFNDGWDMPLADSSREQRMQLAYQRRQHSRNYTPELVPMDLRRAELFESEIQKAELAEPVEFDIDPEQRFRQKTVCNAHVTEMKRSQNIKNIHLFHQEFEHMIRKIKRIKVPEWMKDWVGFPMGPKCLTRFMTTPSPNIPNIHRHECLAYPANSSAYIYVDLRNGSFVAENLAKSEMIAGSSSSSKNDVIYLASSTSGFASKIAFDSEPEYVDSSADSPFVLIADEKCAGASDGSAKIYYEYLLECNLRGARHLLDSEKRFISNRTGQFDLITKTLRLLEFESQEEKVRVLARFFDQHPESDDEIYFSIIDVFYCETMFDPWAPFEEVFITIDYNLRTIKPGGVRVHLSMESDKEFAIQTFQSHGLRIVWCDENCEENPERRLNAEIKDFVLQNFPRHIRTFEARNWLVERILRNSRIAVGGVEPYEEKSTRVGDDFSCDARRRNLKNVIDYEVYKEAHLSRTYQPIPGPWDRTEDGSRGARFFVAAVIERPDVPWRTIRVQSSKYDKTFAVIFQDTERGLPITNRIIQTSFYEPIFRADASDRIGPELTPVCRISMVISRAMRFAFDRKIIELDKKLRFTFPNLSANEDELMRHEESYYYSVRLHERWEKGSERGVIGVAGWNRRGMVHFFNRLQNVLSPLEFNAESQPDLLFGVGEIFAKNLEKKYQNEVLIDVDKFRQIISVFGSSAVNAYKDLEEYKNKKSEILVHVDIPLEFPDFNMQTLELLNNRIIANISKDLNAHLKIWFEPFPHIAFSGTVEAYEELHRSLANLTSQVFKLLTSRQTLPQPASECPACFCETDVTGDFYRLECGHTMCRPCLNNMIRARISESMRGFKFQCQVANCGEIVGPTELLNIILGDSSRIRELDSRKLQRLTECAREFLIYSSDARMKACDTTDCHGIRVKSPGDVLNPKKCLSCNRAYCRQCLSITHPNVTCEDFARLQIPDQSIAEYVRVKGYDKVKPCPKCQVLVEKKDGCNHIECKCGVHFCWLCSFTDTASGPVYGHLNSVHGGLGDDNAMWRLENDRMVPPPGIDGDDLDLDMQRLILAEHQNHGQPAFLFNADEFNENREMLRFIDPPPGLGFP